MIFISGIFFIYAYMIVIDRHNTFAYLIIGIFSSLVFCTCINDSQKTMEKPSFERISSEYSGINFSNSLTPDLSSNLNLFDFDYYYNGSGVATGDFDNDGLIDLVFTANQLENRIYRNKGNLKFEDKTTFAFKSKKSNWSTGVTTVDINNDGLLDIYICQSGPYDREKRKNLLFVNLGNWEFDEQAEKFGLADFSMSTQASFVDIDKDGDLDCVVANESPFHGVPPIDHYKLMRDNRNLLEASSVHVYENINNTFKDITEKAGLLTEAFALGLMVQDMNGDYLPDIYVANDYFIPDALYINKGDFTFENQTKETFGHVPMFSMGFDINDINEDGLPDMYLAEMASSDHKRSKTLMPSMDVDQFKLLVDIFGYTPQYMYNSLQINNGENFSDWGHLYHVAKTDWSWTPLISDFDLDGDKDIYVTNGYRKYGLDNDFKAQVEKAKSDYNNQVPLEVKKELYSKIPEEKLSNIFFENKGNGFEKNESNGLFLESFSNGATYVDLDNDGDLEIIVNNIDDKAFIFKNNSIENGNESTTLKFNDPFLDGIAKVRVNRKKDKSYHFPNTTRGYLSAGESTLILTNSKENPILSIDILAGDKSLTLKPNKKVIDVTSEMLINNTSNSLDKLMDSDHQYTLPNYTHIENNYDDFIIETLLPYKQSSFGPKFISEDIDNDGDLDLFVTGSAGLSNEIWINQNKTFISQNIPDFTLIKAKESTNALFFDIDNDGDKDLYVTNGGNEFVLNSPLYSDDLFINNNGVFSLQNDKLPTLNISNSIALAVDYDKDGDQDLFVGSRNIAQKYPLSEQSYFLENNNAALKINNDLLEGNIGLVNDCQLIDYNKDGLDDILLAIEWGSPTILINSKDGFKPTHIAEDIGLWFSCEIVDFNGDGHNDLFFGNISEGSKYSATLDKPLKVIAGDLDENGSHDLVLSYKYNDEFVPLRGRECSSNQMPFILEKFPDYNSFSNVVIDNMFEENVLDTSFTKIATSLKSKLFINDGSDNFNEIELPINIQSFPVLGVEKMDLNDDGKDDLILVGNIFETEVETPRYDAGRGLILYGASDYNKLDFEELNVFKNSKSVTKIDEHTVIIGNNKSKPSIINPN